MSERFFVRRNGKESGPYSIDELRNAYKSEAFRISAELRLETSNNWFPVVKLHDRLAIPTAPPVAEIATEPNSSVSSSASGADKSKQPNQNDPLPIAYGAEFGSVILIYAGISKTVGIVALLACGLASIVVGSVAHNIVAAIAIAALGVLACFSCIITAEVCLGVVALVRNSFRACELLDRIRDNTKRN